MDAALINKRLEYLKRAYPESAPALQSAQDFMETMVKIQTLTGPISGELGAVSEAIMAMAKEQEA